jgi:hypothetical protein
MLSTITKSVEIQRAFTLVVEQGASKLFERDDFDMVQYPKYG